MVLDKSPSLSRPLILKGSISSDTSIRQGSVVVEGMDSGVQETCVQSVVLTLTLWPQASPLLCQTWFFSSHFVVVGMRLCIQYTWGPACSTVGSDLWVSSG